MILEGLITTRNADGTANIAPMGPLVDDAVDAGGPLTKIVLRPFQTSTTYQNLKRTGEAVFHVTDDVEMIARAAVGKHDPLPELMSIAQSGAPVIASACRWYAVQVSSLDDSQERTQITARVIADGRLRDFFGFNRGKHAVIEAAVLATRLHLTGAEPVLAKFAELQILIDKTGGPQEQAAFELLRKFVQSGEAP